MLPVQILSMVCREALALRSMAKFSAKGYMMVRRERPLKSCNPPNLVHDLARLYNTPCECGAEEWN